MGGFAHTASADVYKRWCAFGLLSSHSRLHGANSYRVPWLFDEVETHRRLQQVMFCASSPSSNASLMPYLFGTAVEAHERGIPMMRAMPLAFPDDPGCDTLDRQYMLGDSLLVAPVLSADGMVDYYLPARTLDQFPERRSYRRRAMGARNPRLPEPSAAGASQRDYPYGANDQKPDYDLCGRRHLPSFRAGGRRDSIGECANTQRRSCDDAESQSDGSEIHIEAEGTSADWSVLLRGISTVTGITGR